MAIGANLIIGNPATFGGRAQAQPGRLRGTVGIEADPQANLHVSLPVHLAGTVTTSMRYSGELAERLRLVGTLDTGIDLEGAARIAHNVEGELPVNAPTQGHIFPPITMRGTLGVEAIPEADSTVIRALRGAVPVTVTPEASLPEIVSLAGTLDLGVTVTGEMANGITLAGTVGAGVDLEGDLYVAPAPAPLDPDAQAIIDAMSNAPTVMRQELISDTVVALKNAGIWDKLDCLALFAAHDEQAALVNWKDPSTPLINATMTYGTDFGFTSTDGSNIQWSKPTAGAQYTETDALLAHYTDATDLEVQYLYTGLFNDGGSLSAIQWNGGTDAITYRVNRSAGIGPGSGAMTDPSGFIAAYRQGANSYLWTPNLTHGPSAPGNSIALGNVISAGEAPNPVLNIGATFKALVVGAYVDPATLNTILNDYLAGLLP